MAGKLHARAADGQVERQRGGQGCEELPGAAGTHALDHLWWQRDGFGQEQRRGVACVAVGQQRLDAVGEAGTGPGPAVVDHVGRLVQGELAHRDALRRGPGGNDGAGESSLPSLTASRIGPTAGCCGPGIRCWPPTTSSGYCRSRQAVSTFLHAYAVPRSAETQVRRARSGG